MAFTKLNDANVGTTISGLGDNPNTDDNLTAAQLKAKFDYDGATIKTYLNDTLVNQLNAYQNTVTSALNGKMPSTGVLPANVGIKIGPVTPTAGTGTNQIAPGQIYLKYT